VAIKLVKLYLFVYYTYLISIHNNQSSDLNNKHYLAIQFIL